MPFFNRAPEEKGVGGLAFRRRRRKFSALLAPQVTFSVAGGHTGSECGGPPEG